MSAPDPTAPQPVQFSQTNKLCFRASPQQAVWLAEHMAATGLKTSRVLRDSLDLYIAANQPHSEP